VRGKFRLQDPQGRALVVRVKLVATRI